jgi:uncharacterized membrane protein
MGCSDQTGACHAQSKEPIHPMLVTLPIALFIATFACDLVYWRVGGDGWATAAIWLLGAGLIAAAAAAVVGLIDFLGDQQIYSMNDAWWHAGGNVLLVLIELYGWYARYTEGAAAVVPKGLILSLIAVALLLFTGWKGGELVYRYRVGVEDDPEAGRMTRPSAGPRRAA